MTRRTEPIFPELYSPDERDRAVFGDHYTPPATFIHGQEHRIAVYPKAGGDGQPVEVYQSRWPARFFTIKALPSPNSVGEPQAGFTLSTGSGDGMAALAHQIATAIAEGMLGVSVDADEK